MTDAAGTFLRVFRFLGLLDETDGVVSPSSRRLSSAALSTIVESYNFSVMTGGRKPGEEDPNSHCRCGKPGDWVNHFTSNHVESFKRRYNSLLLILGYEDNPDWSLPPAKAG